MKNNINSVIIASSKKGMKLLNENQIYRDNKQKFDFIDLDGFLYRTSYNNLTRRNILDKYCKKNPYHLYNLNNYIKINNIKSKIISEDFLGTKQVTEFQCGCGNLYTTTVNEFLYGNKQCCNCCSNKERWSIDSINKHLIKNGIELKLLSKEYENIDTILEWECKCENIFYRSWHHVKEGFTKCQHCTSKEGSSYEKMVELYLTDNGLNYRKQYKFPNCKNIFPLPFDFAIFSNGKIQLLIECDGIQHFESVDIFGGKEKFEQRKKNDNIKNTYCEKHNIKLVRIPYWEFKNENYINILQANL